MTTDVVADPLSVITGATVSTGAATTVTVRVVVATLPAASDVEYTIVYDPRTEVFTVPVAVTSVVVASKASNAVAPRSV